VGQTPTKWTAPRTVIHLEAIELYLEPIDSDVLSTTIQELTVKEIVV